MAEHELPARSVYILYWKSVFNPFWRNNFAPEIDDLTKRHDLETVRRLKGFDFLVINVNPYSPDSDRYTSIIRRFKGQKLVGWPLIILDEGKTSFVVNSSYRLKQLEKLFSQIHDYYLR